jgi:hypothetical protein
MKLIERYSEVRLIDKPNHWKMLGDLKDLHLGDNVNKDFTAYI